MKIEDVISDTAHEHERSRQKHVSLLLSALAAALPAQLLFTIYKTYTPANPAFLIEYYKEALIFSVRTSHHVLECAVEYIKYHKYTSM